MKLSYEHYLFSCLADNVDNEWANTEYDIRFQWLPLRYGYFEQSQFNVEDKSEYECIAEYLHARENLRTLIKQHDFTYDYSDDHRVYTKGSQQLKKINEVAERFTKADFIALWNQYAPEIMQKK